MKSKNRIAAEQASAHVQEQYKKIKDNVFRQKYHFEVPAGWCNDPNGFSYHKGMYHLFYQHMPYVATPGDYVMCWGHAVSKDLVTWEHLPVALTPVDECDNAGCWSGCAVEYKGKMMLFYTGLARGKGNKQMQSLALSEDGIYFEKYEYNPILPGPLCDNNGENFRDPCIWKHGEEWYMVVGSSKGEFGRVLLYKSSDLFHWEYVNDLVESLGELGTVCECPNFFELDGKYVLFISPHGLCQRKSIYLIGDFDYKTGKFFWYNYGEIDWGMDFYAPQVLSDVNGRKIMIGWMNSWDWMPWCDGKYYTSPMGWCGGMSLPRELSIGKDGRLVCKPVEELHILRKEFNVLEACTLTPGKNCALEVGDNIHCEMKFWIDIEETNAEKLIFEIKDSGNHKIAILFDLQKAELIFDRRYTLSHRKDIRKCAFPSVMRKEMEVHIFLDSTSAELFTDGYMLSMSNTFYLSEERKMEIRSEGGRAVIKKVKMWALDK